MEILLIIGMVIIAVIILTLMPKKASAHCDTMDGPAVKDGQEALETGNINYAYKWIFPEYEEELKEIYDKSVKIRKLGEDAKEVADRWFLENFVRIHRAGEGASYDGLKPSGTEVEAVVVAADKAIDTGDMSPLKGLVTDEEYYALEEKFNKAMALKGFDINDVKASREYVEAYVTFFKMAEGEEHEHHGHGHEGHGHGLHQGY
ncbi:MAG TPA: LysM domain-containing protein [Clostridiales bacterium]|nr:LysM domain-containing protein [Clostridiales bacterium]